MYFQRVSHLASVSTFTSNILAKAHLNIHLAINGLMGLYCMEYADLNNNSITTEVVPVSPITTYS